LTHIVTGQVRAPKDPLATPVTEHTTFH